MLRPSGALQFTQPLVRFTLRLIQRLEAQDDEEAVVAAELELPAVGGLLQQRVDVVVTLPDSPQPCMQIGADAHPEMIPGAQ